MPCPVNGPCSSYITEADLCCLDAGSLADPCISGDPVPSALLTSTLMAASEVAWGLTGRQFGICEVTVRPCYMSTADMDPLWTPGFISWPYMSNGLWYNFRCNESCDCHNFCEVLLPNPICSVSEVKIDGVILAESAYVVKNNRNLVRIDGECWPECNSPEPDTEEGTWTVTLEYGREVPGIVKVGTADLACQLLKACLNKPCDLPQRVQNVARNGISMSFSNVDEFLKNGRTGIVSLDYAIATYNPHGVTQRPTVWSPDVHNWDVIG